MYNIREIVDILGDLRPTFSMKNAAAVTAEFLETHGIEGVIWDVDGTLMNYHDTDIAVEFRDQIRALFEKGPCRHGILSNCDETRYPQLGEMFPEIPVLRGYTSPTGPILRVLEQGRDSHSADDLKRILRQGKVLRKPSGKLIELAMGHMNVADKAKMMMIGDQYLTDIASGNMGGILTARVPAYGRHSFPFAIRVSQRMEQALFAVRHAFSPRTVTSI